MAWDVSSFAGRLQADAGLEQQTDARMQEDQALMRRLGIRGVPQLLAWVGDDVVVFSSASLNQGPANLLAEIRNRIGAVLPDP